jgi:hypothetical protein
MLDYDSFRIYDFTGFEKEFMFNMKVNGSWEEFICTADYHISYDSPEDHFTLILDKVDVVIYDDVSEGYIDYSLSKEEFQTLQSWMQDSTNWEEYYDSIKYDD